MKRRLLIFSCNAIMLLCTIALIAGFFVRFVYRDGKNSFSLFDTNGNKPIETRINAKTHGKVFQILQDGQWKDIFLKGVNIGAALPGKWFTEFPEDEETYLKWFDSIGKMNANCIRVYTLLPPEFYKALGSYNNSHPSSKLWLFQEIWPEENPEDGNYLDRKYCENYLKEIEYVIDAVHGKADIPKRTGRAYGLYTCDVSDSVLGYLIGRELEPDEVLSTNEKNSGYSFKGDFLSVEDNASASEAWLAQNCDYVVGYEEKKYKNQHPVSIVSWPTLDPIEHDSEWNASGDKSKEYNDKVSININHFVVGKEMKAGFFGAYHIYPNYPDFMNNEEKYDSYTDDLGRFRYGGYLKEFMENHTRYPALVAEFGLATGSGNAHTNPDGYNHGGLTEEQQGKGVVRMMKAIHKEGYAGGIIFEWMDEWAKKTWTSEPFMIPYDRHVLWHNTDDPEQNYGLAVFEPEKPGKMDYAIYGDGLIKRIEAGCDGSYLYMDIILEKIIDFECEKLLVGLDTYDRKRGEFKYNPSLIENAPSGMEFLIDLSGRDKSKLLVHPGYNKARGRYASYAASNGIFEESLLLINNNRVTKGGKKIEAEFNNASKLNFGEFDANSYSHWYTESSKIHIRIPWQRLNFTDPSGNRVLDDTSTVPNPLRDQLKTVATDGVVITALMVNLSDNSVISSIGIKDNSQKPFLWKGWEVPQYRERLKTSYEYIKEYFGQLR